MSKNLNGIPCTLVGSFWKWNTLIRFASSHCRSSSGTRSAYTVVYSFMLITG